MAKSSTMIHPLWIFSLSFIFLGLTILFGYRFLSSEEWLLVDADNNAPHHHPDDDNHIHRHCRTILSGDSRPHFSKLVLVLIDALRVDFVRSISRHYRPPLLPPADPLMPYMEKMLKTHGIGLTSIASIPTVTLPRIKALITGTLPSFMDYFLNLNIIQRQSATTTDDNIVQQFRNHGHRIVFYGDDTWAQMFPAPQTVFSRINLTSSLFATDYTEVDSNVTYNVNRDLKRLDEWNVMIAHYLGVDHIGHLRGFHSDLYPEKLHEMDAVFRNIFDTLTYSSDGNEPCLVVVTGDHGMTDTGNHGGDTRDETHTAMMFFSTDRRHVRATAAGNFDTGHLPGDPVLQIDFAATISALYNLDFPVRNQGRLMSSVLERFGVPSQQHLCLLLKNAVQIRKLLKPETATETEANQMLLQEALAAHQQFLKNPDELKELFEKSKRAYQEFMAGIQRQFVHQTTDRSLFSALSLVIIICFGIVLVLLAVFELAFNRDGSILFSHTCPEPTAEALAINFFAHLRFIGSGIGCLTTGFIFLFKFIFMGSVNLMLKEQYLWYYGTMAVLAVLAIVTLRGYLKFMNHKAPEIKTHHLQVFATILSVIFLFKLLTHWKVPVLQDQDLNTGDVSSWLANNPKRTLSTVYLVSLVAIASLIVKQTASSRSHYILIASFIWIYLYRGQTGQVTRIFHRLPLLNHLATGSAANFYAQIVLIHAAFVMLDCLVIQFFQHQTNRVARAIKKLLQMLQLELTQQPTSKCTTLCTFHTVWIMLSALLLEPALVPVLALNILLERLVNFIVSAPGFLKNLNPDNANNSRCRRNSLFFRLSLYLMMAYAAFYQLGNRNSLSTISVNACFIGTNAYLPALCALFMTVATFSTFIFWFTMFFIRLHEDFYRYDQTDQRQQQNDDLTAVKCYLRNQIVQNYRMFCSIINVMLIVQMAMMAMNMAVTVYLRDHLFVWSIVCPKFVYEFCFTFIHVIFTFIMYAIFSTDNAFRLDNVLMV